MWKRISNNLFTIDFDKFINQKNFCYLPNLDGKLIAFTMKKYNAVNNSKNIKTYHAHNITSRAVITEYKDHIDVLVIELNKKYSIHPNNNNEYEVKDLNDEVINSKFKCKDIRNSKSLGKCDCEIAKFPGKESTQYDFSYGGKVTKYKILFGLTSRFKNQFNGDTETIYNRLVHILNIVNLIYQSNFLCYFTIDEQIQKKLIESDVFNSEHGANNLGTFTGIFNKFLKDNNYDIKTTYDIGHVLSNGSLSGIAFLSSLCSQYSFVDSGGELQTSDVRGNAYTQGYVTEDAWIINVLCHEMGHQFGCQHVHQRDVCNTVPSSSVEPASGSTIMSYAGICPPNVQMFADPYFNRINLWQNINFMLNSQDLDGNNYFSRCGESVDSNKPIPVINNTFDDSIKYIPNGIQFELYADNVSNIDQADKLFYSWEGTDLGNKAVTRSKMLQTPYRTYSNVINIEKLIWDGLPNVEEINPTTLKKIMLYNGYTLTNASGRWQGSIKITHKTGLSDITDTITKVDYDFTGTGGTSTTIELDEVIYYPSSIEFDIAFTSLGGISWASDLLVVLYDNDNNGILAWGGYNLTIPDVKINTQTWDSSLDSTTENNYNNVIALDLPKPGQEVDTYSFQLTVRASYYFNDINSDDVVDYPEDSISTIASKKLFTLSPYNSNDTLAINSINIDNNNINLEWNVAGTKENPYNAKNVLIYASIDNGQNWNYSDSFKLYEGANSGNASFTVSNNKFFNKDIMLKIKFSNNLFILVSDTIQLKNPDTIAPKISLIGFETMKIPVNGTFNDPGFNATDNVDGDITNNVIVEGEVNVNIVDTYTLTYKVSDNAGNETTVYRTVNVVDEIAPVIKLIGDSIVNIYINNKYEDQGATVTDNYDQASDLQIITTANVNTSVAGEYTVKYNCTDSSGNAAKEVKRTVNVVLVPDTKKPVITLKGDPVVDHPINTKYDDAGATASDNVDGDITPKIIATSDVDINKLGTYNVKYNVTDAAGNIAVEVVRTVNIIDNIKPEIILQGESTVNHPINTPYNDLGATASDNVDGDLTPKIVTTSTVNIAKVGSYTVKYNVIDSSGNEAKEVVRTVNVFDNIKPVITLLGQPIVNHIINTPYTDSGATAVDNVDGDITEQITSTSNIDITKVGSYTVKYNVMDTAGNIAEEVVRTVNIVNDNDNEETLGQNLLDAIKDYVKKITNTN